MTVTNLLFAVREELAQQYREHFAEYDEYEVAIVTSLPDALTHLANRDTHTDVIVADNGLGESDVHDLVDQLRQKYPRLLIVLVDEEADFGIPGQADAISTDPFTGGDLARQIKRLIADRQLETIRSDSLPAVRNIAKRLRSAMGSRGKQDAAVATCHEMGFDYVAYYHSQGGEKLSLALQSQAGPNAIQAIAPKTANADDLMGWVMQNGQSRIAGPEDSPNHPLVARGRLGTVVCVPVFFSAQQFGVIAACRDRPNSITQENVMMLELVGAQLGSALAKES